MGSGGRTPWIQPGAAGLVSALELAGEGDPRLLEEWRRTGYFVLVESVRRCASQYASAEEIAVEVVERTLRAVSAGTSIRDELSWMARVAGNVAISAWRQREREKRCLCRLGSLPSTLSFDPIEVESLWARLLDSVVQLPPPFREALCARLVEGWSRATTLRFLHLWWGVGSSGGLRILYQGRRMLRAVLAGVDPRMRWPRRYSQESIVETYPSREELRLGGGADPGPERLREREGVDGATTFGQEVAASEGAEAGSGEAEAAAR